MKKFTLLFVLLTFAGMATSQQENLQELLNRKQYNQIVSFAEQLQAADSSDYQTMYVIGQAYEGLVRYRDAYDFYQHCLTIDSTQTELLYTTARVAANLGRTRDAENYFLTIWESDTTDFYANYQLARFYSQSGNDEYAIARYVYLLEHDPNNPTLLRALGDCYYRLGHKFSACQTYWHAFLNNKENAGLASTLVNVLLPLDYFVDRIERALEICDTALFYNPGNQKILRDQGMTFFTGQRYVEADSVYSYLLAQGDSVYNNLKYGGFSRYYAGKFYDAIELLDKAFSEDSTMADVTLFLGSSLGRTYDRKRAYALFNLTEELLQPNPDFMNLLTQFRADTYNRDGRPLEASAIYYQLWQTNKRREFLNQVWSILGRTDVGKLENDDARARSMFANVLVATDANFLRNEKNALPYVRAQLERFREEMFFKNMHEYPMIAPDNKRNSISAEQLQELIQQVYGRNPSND